MERTLLSDPASVKDLTSRLTMACALGGLRPDMISVREAAVKTALGSGTGERNVQLLPEQQHLIYLSRVISCKVR